jgi:beta-galactosidase
MAHILPHWTWPGREGQITPVHVYTSGDEAELFLNGKSLGRKKKQPLQYRLRWDDVVYQPGELRVVAYKNGRKWAQDRVETAGEPYDLELSVDRKLIRADGQDLAFVTVKVVDKKGCMVPRAKNLIQFNITGAGDWLAADNGDATSFESFQAPHHKAYNGMCVGIVRSRGNAGSIKIEVNSPGLKKTSLKVSSE